MAVAVRPVRSRKDLNDFIRLPWRLYQGDPNWTPPLIASEKKLLDRKSNPFFQTAEAEYFLAEENGTLLGRMAAIVNHTHNEIHHERCGFFGFFESENRSEVSRVLFRDAEAWLRDKGMTIVRGPSNPSMNDPSGLLIDGFKWPAFVMMTYNPRHYIDLIEGAGYTKAMDLFAHILLANEAVKGKIDRIANAVKKKIDVTIRPVNMSRFHQELELVMEVYNDAWSQNWGFVPMTPPEIKFAANDMKAVLLPEFVYFAEHQGRPVGFSLALPDINQALRRCNGKLFPLNWIRFLKFNLRKIPTLRLIALGVKKEYQTRGLGALFFQKYMEEGIARGYNSAELSWILENNHLMNKSIKAMGGKAYKTYRVYEKDLGT